MFDSFMDFTIRNYTKYSGKVGIVGTEDNWVIAVTKDTLQRSYCLSKKNANTLHVSKVILNDLILKLLI